MTATCTHCDTTFHHVDQNEDGSPYIESIRCAHPGCEVYLCGAVCQELSFECEACRKRFCGEHKIVLDGEAYCLGCALAVVEDQEPECECRQAGEDLFDPRGCPAHDAMSPWNVRLRAVTAVQQYEEEVA